MPVFSPHQTVCGTRCSKLLSVKYSISIIVTAEDFLKGRFLVSSFECCAVFPALCKKCCVPFLSLEQPENGTRG